MKRSHILLLLITLCALNLSCSQDDEDDDILSSDRISEEVPISYKVDGNLVEVSPSQYNYFSASFLDDYLQSIDVLLLSNLFVTGILNEDYIAYESIVLAIYADNITTGSFEIDNDIAVIEYSRLGAEYEAISGTINIVELDLSGLEQGRGIVGGTFSGSFEKYDGDDNSPEIITITDGIFRFVNVNDMML